MSELSRTYMGYSDRTRGIGSLLKVSICLKCMRRTRKQSLTPTVDVDLFSSRMISLDLFSRPDNSNRKAKRLRIRFAVELEGQTQLKQILVRFIPGSSISFYFPRPVHKTGIELTRTQYLCGHNSRSHSEIHVFRLLTWWGCEFLLLLL